VVPAPSIVRVPWWTLGLVFTAILAWGTPGATDLFIYDRAALARGEWWRLLTGHLTHFSGTHLLNNLVVLAPAAWLVETRCRSDAATLFVLAALGISIALWINDPRLVQFAGASGIAIAFLVYAVLRGLHERGPWRVVCAILLLITGTKLVAEGCLEWRFSDWQTTSGFVPVWLSHVIGASSGLAWYLRRQTGRQDQRPMSGQVPQSRSVRLDG